MRTHSRRVAVQTNVRGTDLGSFVKLAQEKVNRSFKLPAGYEIQWGGQFENQARANRRLAFVLPVSVAIIFALLFATFHSLKQASLILLNVPFALVGGIGALWLRGLNLNLSASVGFIALFGVAALNGIVLVSHINSLTKQGWLYSGHPRGRRRSAEARSYHRACSQHRIFTDGDFNWNWSRNSTTSRHGCHWRTDHFHTSDSLHSSASIPLVRSETREVCCATCSLEVEPDGPGHGPRRHIVRSAKRREEVIEGLFIRQIDHLNSSAEFVLVAVKNVVMSQRPGQTGCAAESAGDCDRRSRSKVPVFSPGWR